MKKKILAIVLVLLVSASFSSVFASGKQGAGAGYFLFASKEGLVFDLAGWWVNGVAYPSQPLAILMGSWGAGEGELPANKVMGCGLGYKLFAEKEATLVNQLLGWWVNGVAYPSQPLSMIMGSWGADDPAYAPVAAKKVNITLAGN